MKQDAALKAPNYLKIPGSTEQLSVTVMSDFNIESLTHQKPAEFYLLIKQITFEKGRQNFLKSYQWSQSCYHFSTQGFFLMETMPLSNKLASQGTTGIYVCSELEVPKNNCTYKYTVLSQAGITAEPSQQQQCIPKQQIGWQWKYTGRLKEDKKSPSKPFARSREKKAKWDKEDEIKALEFKQRCRWMERLRSATLVQQYFFRQTKKKCLQKV